MSPIAALALQWWSLEKSFDPFRMDELMSIVSDGATQVRVHESHAVVRLPVKIDLDLDAQHERAFTRLQPDNSTPHELVQSTMQAQCS